MLLTIVSFLLITVSLSNAAPDQFVFNVTFNCAESESYQYKIQFVEWDWWFPRTKEQSLYFRANGDDVITKEKSGEAPPGKFNMMIVGQQNGDELTSEGYDVRMLLTHNCTKDHENKKVYMFIKPKCEVGKGICHFKITKDITDCQGEVTNYANLVYK